MREAKDFFSLHSLLYVHFMCVCVCVRLFVDVIQDYRFNLHRIQAHTIFYRRKKRENGSTLLPSEFVCVWYLGISYDAMVSCVCVLMLNSVCRTFFLVHINSTGSKFLTHEHLRHICEKFESRWALKETRIRAHNHHHRREGAKTHGLQRIRSEKDEATHKIINIQCA